MLREFFENNEGRLSIMRLISLILSLASIGYLYVSGDHTGTAVLLGFATGGKVMQSGTENFRREHANKK